MFRGNGFTLGRLRVMVQRDMIAASRGKLIGALQRMLPRRASRGAVGRPQVRRRTQRLPRRGIIGTNASKEFEEDCP